MKTTTKAPAKSATKKPAPSQAPAEGVTRIEAAALVIKKLKGAASMDDIAARADAIYAEGGGIANLKEALADVRRAVRCAAAFELVDVDGDGLVKRR